MSDITTKLDNIAAELQTKGLVRLAAQVDEVSNTLEIMASEEKEAALKEMAMGAALLAVALVSHGKAQDMEGALAMIGKIPVAERTKVINEVKKVVPSLTETINQKTENAMKPLELALKGPSGPNKDEIDPIPKGEERGPKPETFKA